MLQTSKMDREEMISKFEEIKKIDSRCLRTIWRKSSSLVQNAKDHISEELYNSLHTELQCVYYESIYGGDEEDCLMVRNEFINVIDRVLIHIRCMS